MTPIDAIFGAGVAFGIVIAFGAAIFVWRFAVEIALFLDRIAHSLREMSRDFEQEKINMRAHQVAYRVRRDP